MTQALMHTKITVFEHAAHFIIPVDVFTSDYTSSHSKTATSMFTAFRTPHHVHVASVGVS